MPPWAHDVVLWVVLVVSLAANVCFLIGRWIWREPLRFGDLVGVIILLGLIALVVLWRVPDALRPPTAVTMAAILATAGWVFTNYLNRYQDKLRYTYSVIDHFRSNESLHKDVLFLHANGIREFSREEVNDILAQLSNRARYGNDPPRYPIGYAILRLLNFIEQVAYMYHYNFVDRRLTYRNFNLMFGTILIRLQYFVILRHEDNGKAFNDIVWLIEDWYGIVLGKDAFTRDVLKGTPKYKADYRTK